MGHYNSTHAALVEKKHVFGIALLRVRNVKQSSYFRWKWEPGLFLATPTHLSRNEGKRSLCSKIFVVACTWHSSILMKRSLTACVLQMAALQSNVFTTECKFSTFALEHTFLLQPLHCHRWLNGQSRTLYHSREHPRLTKQLHYWNTTKRNSTAQMRWYHKYVVYSSKLCRVWFDEFCYKSQHLPIEEFKISLHLVPQLFWFVSFKQSFFALSMCLRETDYEIHYICTISMSIPVVKHLACWFSQKTDGKPREGKQGQEEFILTERASPKIFNSIHIAEFVHPSFVFV